MRDYHDLKVWQVAHQLTLQLYQVTRDFPAEEKYSLTSQVRRSASGTAATLAEACGRSGNDFGRFCQMAMGSACETEDHLELARDLGFLKAEDWGRLNPQVVQIKRMLTGLLRSPQRAPRRIDPRLEESTV